MTKLLALVLSAASLVLASCSCCSADKKGTASSCCSDSDVGKVRVGAAAVSAR